MGKLYSKEHEWVEVDGENAVIGISAYAVEKLGDITFIELPDEDDELDKDEAFSSIESVKAASDIYAPVSGNVIEVNGELEDAPEKVNESPEDGGWICKVRLTDSSEIEGLMSKEDYNKYIEGLSE